MGSTSPIDGAAQFAMWKNDIERRMRALETAARLPSASLREGALDILADDGAVRARFGKQADGTVAQTFYDASGNELIRLGDRAGTHSLFVTSGGVTTDVIAYLFGAKYGSVTTSESTSSSVVTDLATAGPSVPVTIGASGRLLVLGGAFIGVAGSVGSHERGVAFYRLSHDPNTYYTAGLVGGQAAVEAASAGGQIHTGLTPGASITVQMRYASTFGGSAGFANRWLYAQPL